MNAKFCNVGAMDAAIYNINERKCAFVMKSQLNIALMHGLPTLDFEMINIYLIK